MREMLRDAFDADAHDEQSQWDLIIGPTAWTLHFLLSYGTAAVYCAKAGGDIAPVRYAIAGYTAVALAVIAWAAWRAWLTWGGPKKSRRRCRGTRSRTGGASSAWRPCCSAPSAPSARYSTPCRRSSSRRADDARAAGRSGDGGAHGRMVGGAGDSARARFCRAHGDAPGGGLLGRAADRGGIGGGAPRSGWLGAAAVRRHPSVVVRAGGGVGLARAGAARRGAAGAGDAGAGAGVVPARGPGAVAVGPGRTRRRRGRPRQDRRRRHRPAAHVDAHDLAGDIAGPGAAIALRRWPWRTWIDRAGGSTARRDADADRRRRHLPRRWSGAGGAAAAAPRRAGRGGAP